MTLEEYKPSTKKVKEQLRLNTQKINKIFYYGIPFTMAFSIRNATIFEYMEFTLYFTGILLFSFYLIRFLTRKRTSIHKYLSAIVLALFNLLFTFQSGNDTLVYLISFLFLTTLLMYRNWRVLLTYEILNALFLVFAYVTNVGHLLLGLPSINLTVQGVDGHDVTLLHIGLSIVHFVICILISNYFRKGSIQNIKYVLFLEEQLNIEENTQLAKEISIGKLDGNYQLNENDMLGAALVDMRENLKELKSQEEVLQWQNKGRTILNEVLINSNDVKQLAEELILSLVKYMELYQGGFYTMEKDESGEQILHLSAHYAYDVPDSTSINYYLGEGLIGEAAKGKRTILVDNVPDNYTNIISGLGSALPENILLVPMVYREKVTGVIEIVSFQPFRPFEIEFLESISESIAVTINSANSKEETSKILAESQRMNEELKNQEEAMRLNMEMMEEGQEEIERLNAQVMSTMKAIDSSFAMVEFDPKGNILACNELFEELFGYTEKEIQGESYQIFTVEEDKNSSSFAKLWEEVLNGEDKNVLVKRLSKNGETITIKGHYSPILDLNGGIEKIINICFDIDKIQTSC